MDMILKLIVDLWEKYNTPLTEKMVKLNRASQNDIYVDYIQESVVGRIQIIVVYGYALVE